MTKRWSVKNKKRKWPCVARGCRENVANHRIVCSAHFERLDEVLKTRVREHPVSRMGAEWNALDAKLMRDVASALAPL